MLNGNRQILRGNKRSKYLIYNVNCAYTNETVEASRSFCFSDAARFAGFSIFVETV
jgi:hypothetical protein